MNYLLSEDDRRAIAALIAKERGTPKNIPNRPYVEYPNIFTPEVYIAKTPDGGIPALTPIHTPNEPGTGTADYPRPRYAECDIYQIVHSTTTPPTTSFDIPELQSVGTSRRVYNVYTTAVPANTYIRVHRDKFGRWLADPQIATSPPVTSRQAYYAEFTAVSGGKWKHQPLTLDSSGTYIDDGAATTTFNTSILQMNPSVPLPTAPLVGDRTLIVPSKETGRYEALVWPMASASTSGLVSTVNQIFAGGKLIQNNYLGVVTSPSGDFMMLDKWTFPGSSIGPFYGWNQSNGVTLHFDGANGRVILEGIYSIWDGASGALDGQTGALGFGATCRGGIITVLPSAAPSTYVEGTWTPTPTGLTVVGGVAPTYAGRYTRIGRMVYFTILITTNGTTTTASVASTTSFDAPIAVAQKNTCTAADATFGNRIGLGTGEIESAGRIYPPTWAATTDTIIISGQYEA